MYSFRRDGLRNRRPILIPLATCGIIILVMAIFWLRQPHTPVLSPIPDEASPTKRPLLSNIFPNKKNPEELRRRIQNVVNNRWANYSVYVKDYASEFSFGINESVIYSAASISKLPILTALYYKAQKGDVDLDRVITLQEADIQDYGTGSIRYDTPGATYSIKTLAKLMISQSDNTAAYILANHILGLDVVQELMDSWGLTQTDMVNNKTSNRDMAILMEKLYSKGIAHEAYTLEMLSFLKNTDFEDRLPALLPDSAIVYHKIGNEIGGLHDIGIVVSGVTKYYIGILTTDVINEDEAVAISAQISKAVYDFMKG